MSRPTYRRSVVVVVVMILCLLSSNELSADTIVASNNAEIRVSGAPGTDVTGDPSGIREFAGATSTLFFNVEGSANAPFEVFAVADFTVPANPAASDIAIGATLTIFEDPAAFGVAGPIEVYLASDSSPGLIDVTANPGPDVPSYQTGNDGIACVDPAFGAFATMLGTANFTPTGAGNPTVIPLNFTGAALAHALAVANAGGTLRLLVAPGDANVAMTGAGQGNGDGAPPTLDVAFVESVETVLPDSFKLADGVLVGGGLAELLASDDQYFEVDPSPTMNLLKQRIDLIVQTTSPTMMPAGFSFRVESAMMGGPAGDVIQTVELFNYVTNTRELVDTRPVQNADESVTISPGGDLSRFVNQLNGEITAIVIWKSESFSGAKFTWSIDVDETAWIVSE